MRAVDGGVRSNCHACSSKEGGPLQFKIQYSRPKKSRTRVVVHLDQLKSCPPSMRGVDSGVRSDCHRSSVSHSRVTNVPPPAEAHLMVDVEELAIHWQVICDQWNSMIPMLTALPSNLWSIQTT